MGSRFLKHEGGGWTCRGGCYGVLGMKREVLVGNKRETRRGKEWKKLNKSILSVSFPPFIKDIVSKKRAYKSFKTKVG